MSLLDDLAQRIDPAHKCMNPACDLQVDDGEDCCSQACAEAFALWHAEMAAFYEDDHETELWELS